MQLFQPQKGDFRVAVEEVIRLMEKAHQPIRDAIATLERMRRLQFKSPRKATEMAARVCEAAAVLAPFIEKFSLNPIAENFRQSEAIAREAAKESLE